MNSTPAAHRYENAGCSRNISLCFRQAIENKNKLDFILQNVQLSRAVRPKLALARAAQLCRSFDPARDNSSWLSVHSLWARLTKHLFHRLCLD